MKTMEPQEIQKLLEEVLKLLNIKYESIELIEDIEVHPIFFIRSVDSHLLIGSRGDTLRAINTLLRQMVTKDAEGGEDAHKRKNFLVDVNGYHTRRIRELKKNAEVLAKRVRLFKAQIEMSPMSAYDRMIVHSTFANDPEVLTESVGEGKFRRIVLKVRPKTKC